MVLAEQIGGGGGMERYLDIVVPALRARGDRVVVLARSVAPRRTDARAIPWSDEHDEPSGQAAALVRAEIEAHAPDAVVLHNVLDGGVVAAARGAPRMIYHLHDHRPTCPNGDRVYPRSGGRCSTPLGTSCLVHSAIDGCMYGPRFRSVALLRRRERLRNAVVTSDVVVANSPFIARRAAESGIAGALPVALPLPGDAYLDGPPRAGDGAAIFVGRVEPQKGLRSLIRAIALLPAGSRPPLRVVGDGPDLERCVAEAARRGVGLELLGRRDPSGVRDAIDASSVLALPSLWDEPFGYVGIEAFARGRPVCAYDVGGISWWLRDGENGLLVPAGDERALAGALLAIDPRMGVNARSAAETYRHDPIVDRLRALYAGA
jgi:glycosyltransferase involved in cell wall biosynthesis